MSEETMAYPEIATGSNLDQIGLIFGIEPRCYGETDDEYRKKILDLINVTPVSRANALRRLWLFFNI